MLLIMQQRQIMSMFCVSYIKLDFRDLISGAKLEYTPI